MPFIITTAVPWGENLGARDKYAVQSRRAVATLEKAKLAIPILWNFPANGGRITLDDGTEINVEYIGNRRIEDDVGYHLGYPGTQDEAIAEWNKLHGK